MKLVLMGSPGSGKGTLSKDLVPKYDFKYFSTGDMLREEVASGSGIGNKIKAVISAGDLVSDEMIIEMIKTKLDELPDDANVLFDGFPRTKEQAEWLDSYLSSRNQKIDAVIMLTADHDLLVKRLSGRRNCKECGRKYNTYFSPPPGNETCECGSRLNMRTDDSPETVSKRLAQYDDQSRNLISYYDSMGLVIRIDSEGSEEQVFKKVENELDRRYS